MKSILFLTGLFFSTITFAQTKSEPLKDFYQEGDKFVNYDLIEYKSELLLAYTSMKFNEKPHVKVWRNNSWIEIGNFPDLTKGATGYIEIIENKGRLFVLFGKYDGWHLYCKNDGEKEWKPYEKEIKIDEQYDTPRLFFIDDEIYYADYRYMDWAVTVNKIVDKTPLANPSNLMSYDLAVNPSQRKIVLATKTKKDKYEIVDVQSKSKYSLKGLKTKEINKIMKLHFLNNQLHLCYTTPSHDLQLAKYIDSEKKWEKIKLNQTINQLGNSFSDDLSMIAVDRESNLPVVYPFNNEQWESPITVGSLTSEYRFGNEPKIVKVNNNYYIGTEHVDEKEIMKVFIHKLK